MKIVDRIRKTIVNSKEGFKNYPVTIIALVLLFILSIVSIESYDDIETVEILIKLLTLFIPISLVIKELSKAKFNSNRLKELLLYGISIVGIFLYYRFALIKETSREYIRLVVLNLVFYIIFLYMKKREGESFTEYVVKIFGDIIISGIYGLVLLLGLIFIIFTVENLFDLNMYGDIYIYIPLFIALIFSPLLILSKISEEVDYEEYDYPKALRGLLLYIMIPLSIVYIAILYMYFLKIVFIRELPRGMVSHLVLWYSIIMMGIFFFIKPLLKENNFLKNYGKYMPMAMIPILIMMFLSMGMRINQYGITENRYFVLIMGIWILGINIYLICKRDYNTRLMPISLSILLFISVVGPLSAFNVSRRSQVKRLESVLNKNNMLVDNKIVKNASLSKGDKVEISNTLDYFLYGNDLESVKLLPEDFTIIKMEETFGFEYTYDDTEDVYEDDNKTGSLYAEYENILNVAGFDYFTDLSGYPSSQVSIDDIEVAFIGSSGELKIVKEDKVIYTRDMTEVALNLYEKYNGMEDPSFENKNNGYINNLKLEDLAFEDENKDIKIKVFFERMDLNLTDKSFEGVDMKLFFKLK